MNDVAWFVGIDWGSEGGFNRSLQQLYKEKLQWVFRNDAGLIVQGVVLSVHQVVRRRDVGNIVKRSGRTSHAVCPVGMPRSKPAYRNRWARGGSARMVACDRATWRRFRDATCRLSNVNRSHSCMRRSSVSVR